MLEELTIKNIALIKYADIFFKEGLNILSGETGAGKSMVLGALGFVLGGRGSRELVRNGEEKAYAEAVFSGISKQVIETAKDLGIECDDDCIIIKRTITSEGKTKNRVNGSPVTVSMIRQLAENLIDIHTQNEHQSLLDSSKHIDILDSFCMPEIEEYIEELSKLNLQYRTVLKKLKSISGSVEEKERRTDLLKYKINEIGESNLKLGEEDELLERRKMLNNSEKLLNYSNTCLQLLVYGSDESQAAADKTGEALRLASLIASVDKSASSVCGELENAYAQIKDAAQILKDYSESLSGDPNEINEVEERLDLIYRLKRKYGSTIEEILAQKDSAEEELEFIENSDKLRTEYTQQKDELMKKIKNICSKMNTIRNDKARIIEKQIEKQLYDLEMKNAKFCINVTRKDTFSNKGADDVEFYISANAGEEMKPLSKTASGGEMSRIMLGLKTVTAGNDNIGTFVFDEIDSGVSGKTAQKVAEKMAYISKSQQIICITHLPQIASMADRHFYIEKKSENGHTISNVYLLEKNEQIRELGRLIGGRQTEAVMKAALEMKDLSDKRKKEIRQ
ncbi:MAG: DNA repair protein RecN [Clostridia bacterium]|nr:DNA repair protein RecN [Clostridia bacterium]MCI2000928.1 DNA repair protein RecN [Clostridia bacterium]MCI2015712.1 DNA repair protein RecN [Clostridia bacterium]